MFECGSREVELEVGGGPGSSVPNTANAFRWLPNVGGFRCPEEGLSEDPRENMDV